MGGGHGPDQGAGRELGRVQVRQVVERRTEMRFWLARCKCVQIEKGSASYNPSRRIDATPVLSCWQPFVVVLQPMKFLPETYIKSESCIVRKPPAAACTSNWNAEHHR